MKNLSKTILAVLATGVISCGLFCQQAQAIATDSLANLVANNGSLTIGDKTFTNFTFTNNGLTSFNASGITVTASIDAGTGIYFLSYTGSINYQTTALGATSADLFLSYRVTATAGLIDYIDQRYTGGIAQGTIGSLQVDESVNAGAGNLAESHLSAPLDSSDFPGFTEIGDNLFPPTPQPFLNVSKDITLGIFRDANSDPSILSSVTISRVEQSFHQVVPDGGSAVALLGIALAGIEGVRRLVRTRKA